MNEAEALAAAEKRWHEAHIAEIKALMEKWGVTLDDLKEQP